MQKANNDHFGEGKGILKDAPGSMAGHNGKPERTGGNAVKFRNAAKGVRNIHMAGKFELTTAVIMAVMVGAIQFARITESYGFKAETDALRIESIGLMMIGGVIAIIGFAFCVQGTSDASRNEPTFKNALPCLIIGILGIIAGCVLKTMGYHAFSLCFTTGRIANVIAACFVLNGVSSIAVRMNNAEMGAKFKRTISRIITLQMGAVVLELFAGVVSMSRKPVEGGADPLGFVLGTCSLVSIILSVAAYIVYLKALSKARKMLGE